MLFISGFTFVFVSIGALYGGLGYRLLEHQWIITRVLGALIIVLGLSFLGLIPALQREKRLHTRPTAGLVGAPLLGIVFAVGWTHASARPWQQSKPWPSLKPAPYAALSSPPCTASV